MALLEHDQSTCSPTIATRCQSDRRRLLDHFSLADIAHKVVGVGSVGTRAWILLLESASTTTRLLLQAKQAQALSSRTTPANLGPRQYAEPGERVRVVTGQQLMQATSDIFLGWLRAPHPSRRGR